MHRTNHSFIFFLFFTLCFCQGCSVLNTSERPTEKWMPPDWERSTRAENKVWQAVRAGEIKDDKELSLVECIDIAFTNSPSTREAWNKAKAAQAGIKQAESQWYPQVTGEAKMAYQKRVANANFQDLNQANYTVSAGLEMLLLDLGGRVARVDRAKQDLIAANYAYNQALQDLLRDVAINYYDYYNAQAVVEAARADLENAEMSLDSAQQKLKSGLGVKLDVLQARSDYENALYSLESAKGESKTSRADLARVLGIPADSRFEIKRPEKEFGLNVSEKDVSVLIEKSIESRPDIASARADLRSRESALSAAVSDLWPTLNLGGSASAGEYKYFGSEKSHIFNAKRDYGYTGYLSVNWDIFDGFYLYSKVKEAKALLEAQKDSLKQAELSASAEVWTDFYQYNTAVKKLEFSRSFLQSAQEAYDLALEGYDVGVKNILDLLSAQSQLSDARSKVVSAERDLFAALVELSHSMGAMYLDKEKIIRAVQ